MNAKLVARSLVVLCLSAAVWCGGTAVADYPSEITGDAPTGYWRLGDAAGAATAVNAGSAAATLNGTYASPKVNAAGLIVGDPDTAADFNGAATSQITGSGLSTAGSGGGNVFANDWTIESWFVRDTVAQWTGVFSNNRGGTKAPLMTFGGNVTGSDDDWLGINGAGSTPSGIYTDLKQYGSSPTDYLGKPVYAAITKTGGNTAGSNTITVKANVNGTWLPTAAGSSVWALTPQDGFYIGRHYDGAVQVHDGTIDEVAIYEQALSPQQMMSHYAAGGLKGYEATVVSDGPIGYWHLGEPEGATTAVNSGWGGTAMNGTYIPGTSGSPGKTNAPGIFPMAPDDATRFDGSSSFVSGSGINTAAPGGTNVFAGDWTIEAWFVRDTANADWQGVFSNNANSGEGGGAPIMSFFYSGSSRDWLGMNPAGVSATPDIYVDLDQFGGGGGAYLGKPVYAVMTLSGTQLDMYVNIDGTWLPQATTTLSPTRAIALDTNNDGFMIGRHYWGGPQILDGTIDEVAIYNRALSAAEIRSHFLASVPEPSTLLVWALLAATGIAVGSRRKRRATG